MGFPTPQKDYTVMVVALTYNHASYIEDTLRGIVMQKTSFPVVACVLDDCSSDGTADIVRLYEDQYSDLIKGFYFDNNQMSQGNLPYECLLPWLSRVKYIAVCEGDDYWTDPLKLQKQVEFMEKHPECSLSFHNAIEHWEDGRKVDALFSHIENREYSGSEIYENWIIPTSSCMFNAAVFYNEEIYKLMNVKDFLFYDIVCFLYCGKYGKLYGLEDTMSVYRRSSQSFTLKDESNIHLLLKKIKKCCDHYRAMNIYFESYYGKNLAHISKKNYFTWNLRGLLVSLRLFDMRSYATFLKEGFCESVLLCIKNQFVLVYSIIRLAFKYSLKKLTTIYAKVSINKNIKKDN